MRLLLESFTAPDVRYEVDKDSGRCSCPAFAADGWCKHLEAVGAYRLRQVTLTERPSFSQALSAVVKGIRVRDIREAGYWFKYCWDFRSRLSGSQFRTVRRLLIGSAEDGHSIAVMERVADAFVPLLAADADLSDALAELIRICKVPNWWHVESSGQDYIRSGMLADRLGRYRVEGLDIRQCLTGIEDAVDAGNAIEAMFSVMSVDLSRSGHPLLVAEKLLQIALHRNHSAATRLMRNVYFRHSRSLAKDNNFTCQAAWLLAGGTSPVLDEDPTVDREEVGALLDYILACPQHIIPGWCCDGIHCAGNDVRYAGMWDRMFAVCQQFNHYGRVRPDDTWLENDFYSIEGLRLGKS